MCYTEGDKNNPQSIFNTQALLMFFSSDLKDGVGKLAFVGFYDVKAAYTSCV